MSMAVPSVCRLMVNAFIVVSLVSLNVFKLLLDILLHPFSAFRKSPRNIPPRCLLDSSLGTHEYVTANGLKFHYVAAGDESKPLMLFLHGFPEFWFSWRHQLREFSKDYRVVAVDMRGYNETEHPPNRLDYTRKNLAQDIAELVPALGYSSCILVGHDWGGGVAWTVAMTYPQVVGRLVIMNCPHPKVVKDHIRSNFSQVMKSWYVFAFQFPWLPELNLSICDYRLFNEIFLGPLGVVNKASMPPEIIEAYKYTFSQPGALTGPINYYRCIFEEGAGQNLKPIEMSTLVIWGEKDAYLEVEMAEKHTSVCTNVTVRRIADCSHWVQQEAPDVCNRYMREFLDACD